MDKQVFLIILLFGKQCVYSVENVQINKQMSQESARKECAEIGSSLVNYANVEANPSASVYLSQLVEGESAWINEFAELSPFLAWHGCFSLNLRKLTTSINRFGSGKSLNQCSQECLRFNPNTVYIGIKNKECYCMDYHPYALSTNNAAVNDSLCNIPCYNNVVDSCGGHSFASVYIILEPGSMHWAINEPSKRQCVYVKRNRRRFDLHTASCHTSPTNMVNGFICMNSVYSRLETVNCTKANAFGICDEPSTRQEAYMSCMNRHGKLADLSSESVVPQWMTPTNFNYWISVYRTFGISERYIENKTVCLAAIRVNNTLYLEPDDCSVQKHYLCEVKKRTKSSHYLNTSHTSRSTLDTKSNTSPIIADTKSNTIPINTDTKSNTSPIITETNSDTSPIISVPTTTGAASIKTPSTGYVSPFSYIIPSILTVAFLVILVVLVLYKRRKKRIRRNNCTPDDTYTAIYETDNLENGQNDSAVSPIQVQNGDSKRLTAESTLNKSIRQAQRVKTEELGDKRKKKGKELQTEDYDKIDFKKPLNVRKDANEETNVYNHVLDTTDNNYDTMNAIKSLQSVGPCENDDTYSHMKDGVAMGDYCGLSVQGRKQGDRGKATGKSYSYSKNVGQKDSPLGTEKLPRFVIVGDDFKDDMKNGDDVEETTHPDEPVTYTKISKVGPKN